MPTRTRKQLSFTLERFYQNPVAVVSFELFLSIGAIIFFALFAIRPTLLTMSDLLKEIEDKRELNEKLVQKIAALSSAQTQYLNLEDRLHVLDEAIPANPELIGVLKIIEKIASEQQLVISQINLPEIPEENTEKVSFSEMKRQSLPMTVSVSGDYQSIRSFVEELMKSRRTLIVESVNFTVDDNRGAKSLGASLTISAPYFGK
jgi:Tfp pilus assembly protein PilO